MTRYEKRVKKLHEHVIKNMKKVEKEAKQTSKKDPESKSTK